MIEYILFYRNVRPNVHRSIQDIFNVILMSMKKNQNNIPSEGSNNQDCGILMNNNGQEDSPRSRRKKSNQEELGNMFLANMIARNRPPSFQKAATPLNNVPQEASTEPLSHACLERPVIPKERRRRPSHHFHSNNNV